MKSKSLSATKTKRDRRNCRMRNLAHGGACPECTTNCTLVHRNQVDPSSSVDRFFKIMLGTDFAEVMYVPFKVARDKKWHKYVDKEACLEDTTGEKYQVKISEVDNVVAFKEGWCRFSSDHQLEEGDFLIFNHFFRVKKLHFIVHVFGKSGIEKKFFSRGHDKKVSTMNRNAALLNKTLQVGIRSSSRKKNLGTSVIPEPHRSDIHHDSKTTNNGHGDYTDGKMLQQPEPAPWDVEPVYMLPRDDLCMEDRTCLYDLWSLENNDHSAADVVSTVNDESVTMNHAEKISEPQRDSDLFDMFPVKRNSSIPELQPDKKQNAIVDNTFESAAVPQFQRDLDLRNRLPVKRKFSSPEPQPDKKNVDRYGSATTAQDKRQKVATCGTIASEPLHVPPGMQMVVSDGEKSRTHELKMVECRDRYGPSENINVQREVSLAKTPSQKAKLIKKNIDMSGPASSAQYTRQTVATGGPIRTIKKELDIGDELFDHQHSLIVKKQTISPENVRRYSSNMRKDVKIPKTEPFCSEGISASFVGMESSSAEVDDKPYLLLQSELPSVLSPREKLRTIYLRAKDNKVFPVTYLQKNGVRVLTSGWQLFKSTYHLHAGDRCRIELEDASKRIYRFEVLPRGAVMNLK